MRAVLQDIKKYGELTISYLGRDEFAPASVRQEALAGRYGFKCKCRRCVTEGGLKPEARREVERLYDLTRQQLAPRLEALARDDDDENADGDRVAQNSSKVAPAAAAGASASSGGGSKSKAGASARRDEDDDDDSIIAAAAATPVTGSAAGADEWDLDARSEALSELESELQAASEALHGVLVEGGLDAEQQAQVQASAFGLLELL